uniref:Lipocln_cytosolic_FA-bd_dom domain-containing protein n=1 Tax=Macrostomum lignano TaxID=282301 RepID=A0A1I8FS35_9PLAT
MENSALFGKWESYKSDNLDVFFEKLGADQMGDGKLVIYDGPLNSASADRTSKPIRRR